MNHKKSGPTKYKKVTAMEGTIETRNEIADQDEGSEGVKNAVARDPKTNRFVKKPVARETLTEKSSPSNSVGDSTESKPAPKKILQERVIKFGDNEFRMEMIEPYENKTIIHINFFINGWEIKPGRFTNRTHAHMFWDMINMQAK